jgi:hypothetical protein
MIVDRNSLTTPKIIDSDDFIPKFIFEKNLFSDFVRKENICWCISY